MYTPEENNERHHIQQRKWRIGRGEETEHDRRMEYLSEREQRAVDRTSRADDGLIEL